MASAGSGETPRVYQIVDSIRAQIASGELAPGDQVPTLADIRERWHVAQATAQGALAILKREGVITGGRGKPATVRIPPKRVRRTDAIRQVQKDLVTSSAEERARVGASEAFSGILLNHTKFHADYGTAPASDELAAEFSVPPGTPLLRRIYETTDLDTGFVLLWSQSWIPVALIEANPDLLSSANEPWPGGHQHQLYTVGIKISYFNNRVIATAATAADRDLWGIDQGVPLLRVWSQSVDTQDRVVEVSETVYPADRTEIAWVTTLIDHGSEK